MENFRRYGKKENIKKGNLNKRHNMVKQMECINNFPLLLSPSSLPLFMLLLLLLLFWKTKQMTLDNLINFIRKKKLKEFL